MAVDIVDVKRVDGKVVSLVAWIGNIESKWIRNTRTGKPYEKNRIKTEVQILDQDSLRIFRVDYLELKKKVQTIFKEDRSKTFDKSQSGIQGKLL